MSFRSSLRRLRELLRDDAKLAVLGTPRGWLCQTYYRGRLATRLNRAQPTSKVEIVVNGKPIRLALSPSYLGTLTGVYVDNEYDCSRFIKDHPKTILDLGANIGMGTLYLDALFPGAEFVCVEPDPRNLRLLETNLEENVARARIKRAAVGTQPGNLNLRFGDDPTCSALETSPMHTHSGTVSVPVTTMSALLEEFSWPRVDLLKIDIEGTEDELLTRNHEWLDRVGAILLEIHPNTSAEKLSPSLSRFGFSLRRLGRGREPVFFACREGH